MDERKHTSNGVPTFDMIPMLMANLLEDNKILSAKLDVFYVFFRQCQYIIHMQLPIRVYYGNMAQRYSNSLKKVKVYLLNKVKIAFLPPFLRQNTTLTLSFPYLFGLFVL